MSRRNGTPLRRIGSRCVGHVAAAMLLTVLAMLPCSASARPAQDARQENALEEPGKAESPAAQQAISMPLAPRPYTPVLLIVAGRFGLGYQRLQFVEDRWQAVDPPSRQSVGDLRIRLPKMVPVRGRLRAPDGTPAEGVVVRTRFIAFRDYRLKVCHCGFDLRLSLLREGKQVEVELPGGLFGEADRAAEEEAP